MREARARTQGRGLQAEMLPVDLLLGRSYLRQPKPRYLEIISTANVGWALLRQLAVKKLHIDTLVAGWHTGQYNEKQVFSRGSFFPGESW